MKKEKTKSEKFFGVFEIFGLFILGGIFFRYGVELLDEYMQYIKNIFIKKNTEVGLVVEDLQRENQKRQSIVQAEFPINDGFGYNPQAIGFYIEDDYEEEDYGE